MKFIYKIICRLIIICLISNSVVYAQTPDADTLAPSSLILQNNNREAVQNGFKAFQNKAREFVSAIKSGLKKINIKTPEMFVIITAVTLGAAFIYSLITKDHSHYNFALMALFTTDTGEVDIKKIAGILLILAPIGAFIYFAVTYAMAGLAILTLPFGIALVAGSVLSIAAGILMVGWDLVDENSNLVIGAIITALVIGGLSAIGYTYFFLHSHIYHAKNSMISYSKQTETDLEKSKKIRILDSHIKAANRYMEMFNDKQVKTCKENELSDQIGKYGQLFISENPDFEILLGHAEIEDPGEPSRSRSWEGMIFVKDDQGKIHLTSKLDREQFYSSNKQIKIDYYSVTTTHHTYDSKGRISSTWYTTDYYYRLILPNDKWQIAGSLPVDRLEKISKSEPFADIDEQQLKDIYNKLEQYISYFPENILEEGSLAEKRYQAKKEILKMIDELPKVSWFIQLGQVFKNILLEVDLSETPDRPESETGKTVKQNAEQLKNSLKKIRDLMDKLFNDPKTIPFDTASMALITGNSLQKLFDFFNHSGDDPNVKLFKELLNVFTNKVYNVKNPNKNRKKIRRYCREFVDDVIFLAPILHSKRGEILSDVMNLTLKKYEDISPKVQYTIERGMINDFVDNLVPQGLLNVTEEGISDVISMIKEEFGIPLKDITRENLRYYSNTDLKNKIDEEYTIQIKAELDELIPENLSSVSKSKLNRSKEAFRGVIEQILETHSDHNFHMYLFFSFNKDKSDLKTLNRAFQKAA